jgi:anaerobic selenocysteine-containing dehydrogenase
MTATDRTDPGADAAPDAVAAEEGGETDPVEHHSFCRFCPAVCGVIVTTRGDRVEKVRADPDHPVSRGYTCPKGRALGTWHHHPRRLDRPEVGRGQERSPAAWDECLGDLAGRLRSVIAEHGPSAVGVYQGTGAAFDGLGRRIGDRFLRAIGSPQRYSSVTIDTPAWPLVADRMGGFRGLVPALDHDQAGLTIAVGTNPVVSHGHTTGMSDPVVRLRALATEPRELWVIDPRRTETARLATRHLQIRPGTDHVLFAWLVRELLGPDGGVDIEYCENHTTGIEELAQSVARYDLELTTALTGLEPSDLTGLLGAIRRHGRCAVLTGTGMTMTATANASMWLAWALQAITGSWERPGGMWFQPGALKSFDQRDIPATPDEVAPVRGPASRPDVPGHFDEYPSGAMLDEIASGNLRALLVLGGNPLTAFPDTQELAKAMGDLEVLAVADVVETETTALATHVLPVAGQLERADVPDFVDQWSPVLASQYTAAVLPPGAQRRPMWWAFARLGELMDVKALPGDLTSETASDDALLDHYCSSGRFDMESLRAAQTAVVAEGPVHGWVRERVLPGGRWRLAPQILVDDLERVAATEEFDHPRLELVPRRLMKVLNSQLRFARAAGASEDPFVLVNPVDAERAGVSDGQSVVVATEHGSTTGIAHVSDEIRAGAVSVPHGWSEPGIGHLTTGRGDTDPVTGMVRQGGLAVTLRPLGG